MPSGIVVLKELTKIELAFPPTPYPGRLTPMVVIWGPVVNPVGTWNELDRLPPRPPLFPDPPRNPPPLWPPRDCMRAERRNLKWRKGLWRTKRGEQWVCDGQHLIKDPGTIDDDDVMTSHLKPASIKSSFQRIVCSSTPSFQTMLCLVWTASASPWSD